MRKQSLTDLNQNIQQVCKCNSVKPIKFLFYVFIVFEFSACISITSPKEDHKGINVQNKVFLTDDSFEVYFRRDDQVQCVSTEQKGLLKNWIEKYFPIVNGEIIKIVLEEQQTASRLQTSANGFFTALTLGIIPFFDKHQYDIIIVTNKKGSSLNYSSVVESSIYGSILTIPFYHLSPGDTILRNNMENGIFQASQVSPVEKEFPFLPIQKSTVCSGDIRYHGKQEW